MMVVVMVMVIKAESREQRALDREQRAKSRDQRAESRKQTSESRQKTGESKEHMRQQRAESTRQRAANLMPPSIRHPIEALMQPVQKERGVLQRLGTQHEHCPEL
jgi:hypothetical protein